MRKVFQIMRGFGDHLQFSVFRAELSNKECIELKMKLNPVLNHKEDQVLFIPIGPAKGEIEKNIEALGLPYQPSERSAIVI